MKILGVDYGEAKIGLALGDVESGVATPFGVLKNLGWNNASDEIKKLCAREGVVKIIVGVPINPQKIDSKDIKTVEDFITLLKKRTGLAVEGRDERFSTQEAQKLLEKNKANDDDISAMLILQGYFDSYK